MVLVAPKPALVDVLSGKTGYRPPTPVAPAPVVSTVTPVSPTPPAAGAKTFNLTQDVKGPTSNALASALVQQGYGMPKTSLIEALGGIALVGAGTHKQNQFETAEKERELLPAQQIQEFVAQGGDFGNADALIATGTSWGVEQGMKIKQAQIEAGLKAPGVHEVNNKLVNDRGEVVYSGQPEPYSDLAKLEADYKAGLVSDEAYAAALNKLTREADAEGKTTEMKNWEYGQANPGFVEALRENAKAGASVVSMSGDKMSPEMVKRAIDFSDQATTMLTQVDELKIMADIAERVDTGYFAPLSLEVKSALQSLGIDLGPDISADISLEQLFRSQSNQMALRLRNPESGFGLPGSASNFDITFLLQSVAGLGNTQEANKLVLIVMGAKARRQAELAQAKSDFMFANNSLAGWGDVQKAILENSMFTEDEQAFMDSIGSRVPPLPEGTTKVNPGALPGVPEGLPAAPPSGAASSAAPTSPAGRPSTNAEGKPGRIYTLPTGEVFVPDDAKPGTKIPVPGGGHIVVN